MKSVKRTNEGLAYWQLHLEAIKREAISTNAYARRHGIEVKRLYYWQSKSRTAALAAPVVVAQPQTFVAMHIAKPVVAQAMTHCTLMLGAGICLEMSALPSPQWLVALCHAAQGAR